MAHGIVPPTTQNSAGLPLHVKVMIGFLLGFIAAPTVLGGSCWVR